MECAHLAGVTDLPRGEKTIESGTTTEIDDDLARLHGGDCLRVAAAKPEIGTLGNCRQLRLGIAHLPRLVVRSGFRGRNTTRLPARNARLACLRRDAATGLVAQEGRRSARWAGCGEVTGSAAGPDDRLSGSRFSLPAMRKKAEIELQKIEGPHPITRLRTGEEWELIPAPFAYHRPQSLREAIGLLAEHGEDARVVAGGHSLIQGPTEILPFFGAILLHPARLRRPRRPPSGVHPRETRGSRPASTWSL